MSKYKRIYEYKIIPNGKGKVILFNEYLCKEGKEVPIALENNKITKRIWRIAHSLRTLEEKFDVDEIILRIKK